MKRLERIQYLHQSLQSLSSLAPSSESNQLFEELVQLTACDHDHSSAELLKNEQLQHIMPSLQSLCAHGEFELEKNWAERIISANDPWEILKAFPYYQNYLQLVRLDYQATKLPSDRDYKRPLFVGSGPLPLTAIIFAMEYGMQVDALDNDPAAIELSTKLIHCLGLKKNIRILHGDITTFDEVHRYDLVFLAALVGVALEEKAQVIASLRETMIPGSLLIARTAHGLRTLLYPAIPLDLFKGFSLCATITPHNNIVNSVIITQKE